MNVFSFFFFSFFFFFDMSRYTGFSYTTMRDISYTSTYFLVYEPLKQSLAATFASMRHKKLEAEKKDTKPASKTTTSTTTATTTLSSVPTEAAADFSVLAVVLSGGTSGALAWTVALPFDYVKTLIQRPQEPETHAHGARAGPGSRTGAGAAAGAGAGAGARAGAGAGVGAEGGVVPKRSAWSVVRMHYARGGLRSFYSGWIPTILRAFVVSGIRFLVYESTAQWLNKVWKKKTSL